MFLPLLTRAGGGGGFLERRGFGRGREEESSEFGLCLGVGGLECEDGVEV